MTGPVSSPQPALQPQHVVCYAPYTNWSIHSARQVTILQALRLRGYSVSYITCDGIFDRCDMTQAANGAALDPGPHACLSCQSSVAARLAVMGMPYRWFGRWLKTADFTEADAWIASLDPRTYATARYDGPHRPAQDVWEVGAWVRSSVHTHLRHNTLDLDDPAVAALYAQYLRGGLIACIGLSRVFDHERPRAQLLFNGRMSSTRVALELAKQRGIKTFCEERSTIAGRMMLFEDANCLDLTAADTLWEAWRGQPLTTDEINAVAGLLQERWRGQSTDVSTFSRGAESTAAVRSRLGLDAQRPLWVLFTSSLDESIDEPRSAGSFPSQAAWIEASIAAARERSSVQLVIRVHPNSGSKRSLGRNAQDENFFNGLAAALPENVRLVRGDDDTSSYTLAALADLGLIWYSTIGLEMAAIGKPVIRAGASWLSECDAFIPIATPQDYQSQLAAPLPHAAETTRRTVQAWRFAYLWYFRQSVPFPLVAQPQWYAGEPAYTAPEALLPGADAHLDRICAAIAGLAPLHSTADTRPAALGEREKTAIMAWANTLRGPDLP